MNEKFNFARNDKYWCLLRFQTGLGPVLACIHFCHQGAQKSFFFFFSGKTQPGVAEPTHWDTGLCYCNISSSTALWKYASYLYYQPTQTPRTFCLRFSATRFSSPTAPSKNDALTFVVDPTGWIVTLVISSARSCSCYSSILWFAHKYSRHDDLTTRCLYRFLIRAIFRIVVLISSSLPHTDDNMLIYDVYILTESQEIIEKYYDLLERIVVVVVVF